MLPPSPSDASITEPARFGECAEGNEALSVKDWAVVGTSLVPSLSPVSF